MTRSPTQQEFEVWCEAFQRGTVTPELVTFVNSVAAAAVAGTTLSGLSPEGKWTPEVLKDAVGDFWSERLLCGTLQQAFEKTDGLGPFGRYLEQALRRMLIDAKRASHAPRLRARVRKILVEGEGEGEGEFTRFSEQTDPGEELWGLSGGEDTEAKRCGGDEASLLTHLHALGLEETIQGGSDRAAVVVSNPELSRLVRGLFERVRCQLTLNELSTAFRQRFVTHYPPGIIHDEEMTWEIGADGNDPAEVVDAREIASCVLARLTERQVVVFVERFRDNQTLEQIAAANGCSRDTADNEVKRASEVIREFVEVDDFARIWKTMLDLSSEGVEVLERSITP